MGLWWALSNRTQLRIGKSAVVLGLLAMCAWGVSVVVEGLALREAVQPFVAGVVTIGTVVDVREFNGRYDDFYTATVAFTDISGTRHTFVAPTTTEPTEVSQPAAVSYVVTDPSQAHDLSARPNWQWNVVMGSLCAVAAPSVWALGIARRGRMALPLSG